MIEYFNQNPESTLIHFTSSLENIISIIKLKHFRLKYCREELVITNDKIASKNVHPMVCFSEQNRNKLFDLEVSYGRYGISVTTEWIVKNNLQPVMYLEKNSPVAKSMAALLHYRRLSKRGNKLRLPIMTIKCFIKNTIGFNSYLKVDDFVFKAENEWRFVPSKAQIGNGFISESRKVFETDPTKYNSRLEKFPLRFENKDIDTIFYDTESDFQKLKELFPELSGKLCKTEWKVRKEK